MCENGCFISCHDDSVVQQLWSYHNFSLKLLWTAHNG